MKTINLPPYAPILMESTRSIGYSLEAAVADIIDNSITAHASKIDIKFFPVGDTYISILDNGCGMNEDELTNAMQYGSKNPNEVRDHYDLGRYGLGLKTASLSQCRRLTVVSLKNGLLSGRRWDLDYVIKTGEWSLIVLEEDEINQVPQIEILMSYKQGTIVVWQSLDRLSVGENDFLSSFGFKMDNVREHLTLVFHRYLTGESNIKKVEITINGNSVVPADPFLSKKSTQIMDDEVFSIRGERVSVRPYILPHISKLTEDEIKLLGGKDGLRKQQGFYVYRNKRLLVWGTWFKMMRQGDLSKLARVQVDIPNSLDDLWTLDIKKSTAIPPENVRKNLGIIIERIAEGSKRTWTFRGKKETDDSKIHVWNRSKTREGGIIYEINRDYPLVESINSKISNADRNLLEQLLTQIERNIPLNSLYVDLTNDEKFYNDKEIDKKDLKLLLMQMLSGCESKEDRIELFERISVIEPFDQHPEWLEEIRKGDDCNVEY